MDNPKIEISLVDFAKKPDSKIYAKAKVEFLTYLGDDAFNDPCTLSISGFTVMKDGYKNGVYRVLPPSIRVGFKWIKICYILPPEKWAELENLIIEKFVQESKTK